MAPLTGRVHGMTIDLDVAPKQPFEGKRVRLGSNSSTTTSG
jgi:hypothetical protein